MVLILPNTDSLFALHGGEMFTEIFQVKNSNLDGRTWNWYVSAFCKSFFGQSFWC